jgi:hypothetical protein
MPTRPSSTGRSATALLVLVTLLPVALALVVYMVSLRDVRLGGDEPHYLIMADSLTTDPRGGDAPSAWPGLVLCDLRVLCVGS